MDFRHGDASRSGRTRLYRIWVSMNTRVRSPRCFKVYLSKGIKVCSEWSKSYIPFKKWALSNGYSDELTLDRIDNDGDYCPKNCRWTTVSVQQHNRRDNVAVTAFGESKLAIDWIKDPRCRVVLPTTIRLRISRGWRPERAISEPEHSNGMAKRNKSESLEREKQILANLRWFSRNGEWARAMDVGGRTGSHHSKTLSKLVRMGYAESRRRHVSIVGALGSNGAGKEYRFVKYPA